MKVLLIDPSSSGRDLAAALREFPEVRIEVLWQEAPFNPDNPAGTFPLGVDVESIRRQGFDRIVAGSESGVSLADALAAELGLPSNDPKMLWHRRNKDGMLDRAWSHGIRVPVSHQIATVTEAEEAWHKGTYPDGVVVKPVDSGGSDSCYICNSAEEVSAAAEAILGRKNLLGSVNRRAVLQERICGEQLFVNTVAEDGEHAATEVFRYGISEAGGTPHIYSAQTLDASAPDHADVVEFVLPVLDALGVQNSATHTEVRKGRDGWVLIEYNGRPMGPSVPTDIYGPIRGYSQVTAWATTIARGLTAARAHMASKASGPGSIAWHMPTPRTSGTLVRNNWEVLRELPSFISVVDGPSPGDAIDISNRVTTGQGGLVFFGHEDESRVRADLDLARQKELGDVLFDIKEVGTS